MRKSAPLKKLNFQYLPFKKGEIRACLSPIARIYYLTCFFQVLVILAYGQSSQHQQLVEGYTIRAENFSILNQPDSASYYYEKLAQVHYQEQQIVDYIYSYIDAAFLYTTSGQYPQATALLAKANQALIDPLNQDERWAFLWLHIHLAHNYHQMGDYLEAKRIYEKALLSYVGEEHRDLDVANYLYRPLGNIYTRLGAHEQAFKLLERFTQISMDSQQFNIAAEGLSDIGILFFDQRNYQDAIKSYQNALELPGINNKSKALVLSNLAGAYMELKQYKKAVEASKQSLRLFDGENDNANNYEIWGYKSGVQNKLAHSFLAQKKYNLAKNHFQKALSLSQKAYGTLKRRETAKIYLGLGQLNLDLKNPLAALGRFQQTLQAVLPEITDDPQQNPPLASLFAENSLMEALEGKALAYQQLYELKGDRQLLEEALKCYELILEVEAKLRQNYQFESSKLFQVNESHHRSEQALGLAFQLFQGSPDSVNFQRAFQISERARSVVLKESLQDFKAQDFAGIPDSLHTYERELKINISLLRKDIIQQTASGDSLSHELFLKKEQLFQLEQALQQLSKLLEADYPAYHKLKYKSYAPIAIDQIQSKLLGANDIIIEYFVGEKSIYILKIGKHELDFIKVDNDFQLKDQVEMMLVAIRDFNSTTITSYEEIAHQLFEKLLSPLALKSGQALLIIPDGILSHLPFAAILKNDTSSANYKHLPYLIREHSISYAYSLTLLKESHAPHLDVNDQKPFLGVAPIYENSKRFAFLNHSADEVEKIHQKLGGDRLLGAQATKQKFMAIANNYQLIHLSSHAEALDSLSIYSWISFSDTELPNEDDHKLYLSEIYALRIPAKLIILGACETGSGQLNNGEGVMSLARGFIHAGCQSVITTLWPVSNNATNQIMGGFYKHLAQNLNKNEALRQAQLDYLNDESTDGLGAHPFFWAPYIALGDNSPMEIQADKSLSLTRILMISGLVLLAFVWISRRKIYKQLS